MLTQKEAGAKIAELVKIAEDAQIEAYKLAEEQGWEIEMYDLPVIEGEESGEGPVSDALYQLARWSSSNC